MKSKRTWSMLILLFTVALCACVFPMNLIRKNENMDSSMNGQYEMTVPGKELIQVFQAQTAYLSEIGFDIYFPGEVPEDGNLIFTFRSEGESTKVIYETSVALTDVSNGAFTYVPVNKWISRGKYYSYTITPEDGTDVLFQAICTYDPADAAPGSHELFFQGDSVNGQVVTRYVYGVPLNYKNVICIWAFIWTICLILLELVNGKEVFSKNKLLIKAESLVEKWQLPILVIELLVILLLIVRISRNEAVDWDEAFTWMLVTKMDLAGMLRATAEDVHPPLYYMMVMAAMKIFGQSIFVAKMVSAAGMFATGILGITLVRKRWGVKAACSFLLVAGLGPQMIYYNVNVRMYSWMCFFVLAAGLFAYEIVQTKKACWWAAFTLVSLAGVYTQYFAVVPLALLYLFLLVWFLILDRKYLKVWLGCSVATILGYLPWLGIVIDTLQKDASAEESEVSAVTLNSLCEWAFGSNIKFSEYMPLIMFIAAIICLIAGYQVYNTKERTFLICTGFLSFLVFFACMILAGHMNHFWHNRYLVDTLLFFWLFILIILGGRNVLAWGTSVIWLCILVLSSYTIMQATEFSTIPWIEESKRLLEPVQEEDKVVYNFVSYDVLYEYYLPDAEFVWYEDVNFSEMGDSFYMISWGGKDFDHELYQSGFLSREVIGDMRFEQGVVTALYKITINWDKAESVEL